MMHLFIGSYFLLCISFSQHSVQATIFVCDNSALCGCSRFDANINARIVGGEIAASHSWGWAASLRHLVKGTLCGGSIISNMRILTAAHCVFNQISATSQLYIVVGADTLLDDQGQRRSVTTVTMHPGFNPTTLENDIAILTVNQSIDFQDANVAKICVPNVPDAEQTHYPVVSKALVAIGWGATSSGETLSNDLRQVTVNAVRSSDSSCKHIINNNDVQFCAGVTGGGKDTCQGDSGGPLMFYSEKERVWVLAGITSYGDGCGLPKDFGVYTRVSRYIDWITLVAADSGIEFITQSKANIHSLSIPIILISVLFNILLCIATQET